MPTMRMISLENYLKFCTSVTISQMPERVFRTKITETFSHFWTLFFAADIFLKSHFKLYICKSSHFQHTKVSYYLKALPSKYPGQKLSCTLTNHILIKLHYNSFFKSRTYLFYLSQKIRHLKMLDYLLIYKEHRSFLWVCTFLWVLTNVCTCVTNIPIKMEVSKACKISFCGFAVNPLPPFQPLFWFILP